MCVLTLWILIMFQNMLLWYQNLDETFFLPSSIPTFKLNVTLEVGHAYGLKTMEATRVGNATLRQRNVWVYEGKIYGGATVVDFCYSGNVLMDTGQVKLCPTVLHGEKGSSTVLITQWEEDFCLPMMWCTKKKFIFAESCIFYFPASSSF